MNCFIRAFFLFTIWSFSFSVFAMNEIPWGLKADAGFFVEGNQYPTSKRGQVAFDFSRVRTELTVFPNPETIGRVMVELERKTVTTPSGSETSVQPRLRIISMGKSPFFHPSLKVELGLLPSIFADEDDRDWLHPRAQDAVILYGLVPRSDLGVNLSWRTDGWPISAALAITNGEGEEIENGTNKSAAALLRYNPTPYLELKMGYLRSADDSISAGETIVERSFGAATVTLNRAEFSVAYFLTQEPAVRVTRKKSFDEADLVRLNHVLTEGEVWRAQTVISIGESHEIYVAYDEVRPVKQNRSFDARQYFGSYIYEVEPGQDLSIFYYRINDEEFHGLRSQQRDGVGVGYRVSVDL